MGDKVIICIIVLFTAVFYYFTTKIPSPHVETSLGGAFWPKLILILLFLTSCSCLMRLLFGKKRNKGQMADEQKEESYAHIKEKEEVDETTSFPLLIFGILISFIYIASLKWVGFTITTPIFMALFLYITGYKKKIMLTAVSLITTAVFLLLFVIATYIPLPRGHGIFKSISVLIY